MTNQPSIFANPYVGPRTFTRAEGNLFFGREREAQDLLALVISQRLVLFYAQSGAGKSSLINTRLIPQLQDAGFAVLPVGRVGGELPAGVEGVANIFLFNLMLSLDQAGTNPQRLIGLTLTEFLERLTSDDGETWRYEPELPAGDYNDTYQEPNYILIIDQFEEIITAYLHRWPERAAFFQALEEAMRRDPKLWVVLTLREDYVAALDPYAQFMTDKLRARFYMERMGVTAALEAIQRPAMLNGRSFAKGVAETLVDNLRRIKVVGLAEGQLGQYVEPVQLQVVCYRLWENLSITNTGTVTFEDLDQLGTVDMALGQFYEQTIDNVVHKSGETEATLRFWIEDNLITEARTRGSVIQGGNQTKGLSNIVLKTLEAQFLLRSELRAGGLWYELTHDRFIEPVLTANQGWLKKNPLIQAARDWEKLGGHSDGLYRGQRLQDALAFAKLADLGSLVAKFLTTSVEAEQARLAEEARRQREQEYVENLAAMQRQATTAKRFRNIAMVVAGVLISILLCVFSLYITLDRFFSGGVETAKFSLDGKNIVAVIHRSPNDLINVWNIETDEKFSYKTSYGADSLDVSKDGNLIYTDMFHAYILNIKTGETLSEFGDGFHYASYSPDAKRIVTANNGYIGQIWEVTAQQEVPRLVLFGHKDDINWAVFSPDGQMVVTASSDSTVRLWDANSGQPLRTFEGHTDTVNSAVFSPKGKLIVSASDDGTARLWDLTTGEQIFVFANDQDQASSDPIYSAIFSPDGQMVVTAQNDKTARLWDVKTGKQLHVLTGHKNKVTFAEFSPNGQMIVTASDDGTVRLWNVNTAEENRRLE